MKVWCWQAATAALPESLLEFQNLGSSPDLSQNVPFHKVSSDLYVHLSVRNTEVKAVTTGSIL